MVIPKLDDGWYSVVTAERSSGIVLNNDGARYFDGNGECFRFFDSLITVKEFAVNKAKTSSTLIEVGIYDHNGNFIEEIIR